MEFLIVSLCVIAGLGLAFPVLVTLREVGKAFSEEDTRRMP